jgi:hypothetical protein
MVFIQPRRSPKFYCGRVSSDRLIRSEIEAAVGAALASLDRIVPETEAATKRALETLDPAALVGSPATEESSTASTRGRMAELGRSALEEGGK